MLYTHICNLLGIKFPIIQAGMGPFTSAELATAVSNSGALGSLGAGARPPDSLKNELARIHKLTSNPFAVNFTLSPSIPDPGTIKFVLNTKPKLISFALGEPDGYVEMVHDAGILVMHQVGTVQQAYHAAQAGVDIIIAQGSEAGGFSGSLASMILIPQVVDAISPIPVVAAGGIADGRGLAAALVLGAQGVNIGTRFLASIEAPITMEWKQAILAAESQDAIKVDFWSDIFPVSGQAYQTIPRALSSPFIQEWKNQPDMVKQEALRLQGVVGSSIAQGSFGELFPFAGQSSGMIKEILPAAQIVHKLVNEAEAALRQTADLFE